MKINVLLISFILSVSQIKSQERFFSFIPDWRSHIIIEKQNEYLSFGLGSIGIFGHYYQFNTISKQGDLNSSWTFSIDTTSATSSMRYAQGVLPMQNSNYITGLAVGEAGDKVFGTLTEFDLSFQDTLQAVAYDLSMDTRMELIIQNNNGNLIVGGEQELSFANYFPFLYEMDLQGNIIWSKSYSCGNDCELFPNHIMQAADGGYFYTCAEVHFDNTASVIADKTAIIKTDSLGIVQYRLHPGQPDNYAVRGWVLPTDDGNYITAYSDPFLGVLDENPQVNDASTIWLYKFDVEGTLISEIDLDLPLDEFGENYQYTIYQIIKSEDNHLIIAGTAGVRKGFVLKVSEDGELDWFRIITPPQSEGNDAGGEYTRVYGVTQTTDGGYIMAGEYFSSPGNIYPEGIQTAIAVKVDEFGCLVAGCDTLVGIAEIPKANLGLRVWPNPASEVVNISVAENVKVERIKVYEITGRVVLDQSPQPPSPRGSAISFDISDLSPGIYLVEVKTKTGQREVKRVVIK